jgi:formylglycine-generating enzyme required for sulfatase activity
MACEYVTNASPTVQVVDGDAWLYPHRFYRARAQDPPRFTPGDTNQMVWVPPGTFLMGSPVTEADREADEGPQATATLTHGFWIGRYEVTQGEYETIMGVNPSYFAGLPNLPVECVSWLDAAEYCVRLSGQERAAGRLPAGWAYRLPTEAEWEYAARAGTTARFSFGDDPDALLIHYYERFSGNPGRATHAVGTRCPNPRGLHDMHGNVAEWCADWYAPYAGAPVTDPQGPAAGTQRVVRGGNFLSYACECRSARRSRFDPDYRYNHACGFRIVLAPFSP